MFGFAVMTDLDTVLLRQLFESYYQLLPAECCNIWLCSDDRSGYCAFDGSCSSHTTSYCLLTAEVVARNARDKLQPV